jgi:hypothetical protein
LRFRPITLGAGAIEGEPPCLLAGCFGGKEAVIETVPRRPGERNDFGVIGRIGQNSQIHVFAQGQMFGQLPRHAAGTGGGMNIPEVDVREQVNARARGRGGA